MKKLMLATMVLILSGCSTDPVTLSTASPAVSKHIYAPEIVNQPVDSTQGRITIFRDKGFTGSGCTFDIALNGTKAFSLSQGEYLTVQLSPKEYILSASIGGALCPNLLMTQTTNLKAGEDQQFRIGWASSGQWIFARLK